MTQLTQPPFTLPVGMTAAELSTPEALHLSVRLLHPNPESLVNIRAKLSVIRPGDEPLTVNLLLPASQVPDRILTMDSEGGDWEAIWWTLNSITPGTTRPSIRDQDVDRYTHLLVDFDPSRSAGTNSTHTELSLARDRCAHVVTELTAKGWPLPAIAMSGNGYQAIWAIDLPNDKSSANLVHAVLQRLNQLHGGQGVDVDTSVFNASRVVKAWGSMTRKGPHSEERPQRRSMPIAWPQDEKLAVVPPAALQALAGDLVQPARSSSASRKTNIPEDGSDIAQLAARTARLLRALQVEDRGMRREKQGNDEVIKLFVECPNAEEHSSETDGESAVIIHRNEAGQACRSYKCFHQHCVDLCDWKTFIARVQADSGIFDDFEEVTVTADADPQPTPELPPSPPSPPPAPVVNMSAKPEGPSVSIISPEDAELDRRAAILRERSAKKNAPASHKSVTRAEAIASAVSQELEFPIESLHGPLGDIALGSRVSLGLSYLAAVTIFSAIPAEDRMAGVPLQMYAVLLAPVGCGKDVALDRTRAAFPEKVEGLWTMKDVISTTVPVSDRGLINMLAQPKPTKPKRGFAADNLPDEPPPRPKPTHRLIFNYELSSLFAKGAVDNSTLLATCCSLYDHGSDTATGVADRDGERQASARLSILGGIPASATNPERFQEIFGASSCHGMYSRLALGYADRRKYYGDDGWVDPRPASHKYQALEHELDGSPVSLRPMPAVSRRMNYVVVESICPAAEALFRDLWESLFRETADDEDEQASVSRLTMLAKKVAVLTASAAGESVVSEECAARAILFVRWQRALRRRFAPGRAVTPSGRLVERILAGYRAIEPGTYAGWRTMSSRRKWYLVAPHPESIPRTIRQMVLDGLLIPDYTVDDQGIVTITKRNMLRLAQPGDDKNAIRKAFSALEND